MNTLTQTLKRRQAVIQYSFRCGVSAASERYNVSRPTIYSWRKRYDGSLDSLKNFSRRPKHHPNQHTEDELKLIRDMRRRNPNDGLVVFWVKLQQRGYTRSISGLCKVLHRLKGDRVKLPNPKIQPKPYEQMLYPGQRGQIDVKIVPTSCLVGEAAIDGGYCQYTLALTPLPSLSAMWWRNSLLSLNVFRQTTVQSLPTD